METVNNQDPAPKKNLWWWLLLPVGLGLAGFLYWRETRQSKDLSDHMKKVREARETKKMLNEIYQTDN